MMPDVSCYDAFPTSEKPLIVWFVEPSVQVRAGKLEDDISVDGVTLLYMRIGFLVGKGRL